MSEGFCSLTHTWIFSFQRAIIGITLFFQWSDARLTSARGRVSNLRPCSQSLWTIRRSSSSASSLPMSKLWFAGDSLPDKDIFTIFRGVVGKRGRRRVRSWSWTLSLERASWFATRYELPDPAVYQAKVNRITYRQADDHIISASKIAKLYGDYLFSDIKNTAEETEELTENMRSKMR